MKIATWNVNSLTVRLGQVIHWLDQHPVEILCLQELKLSDEKFPIQALNEVGYQAVWSGQKAYNGVAILTREPVHNALLEIPGYEDAQRRFIACTLPSPQGDIRIICVYCPNGQSVGSEKYEYKLQWYTALQQWLKKELAQYSRLVIAGDYNVAPADEDVYDPARWVGHVLVSEPERAAFFNLLNLGLKDSFRLFPQAEKSFSWWDYRQFAFKRNAGMRIDHILLSNALSRYCTECVIDKAPRSHIQPSDHTPVVTTLELMI